MGQDKNENKPYCLYVSEPDMTRLRIISKRDERTVSYMIRKFVREFLEKNGDDDGEQKHT